MMSNNQQMKAGQQKSSSSSQPFWVVLFNLLFGKKLQQPKKPMEGPVCVNDGIPDCPDPTSAAPATF